MARLDIGTKFGPKISLLQLSLSLITDPQKRLVITLLFHL